MPENTTSLDRRIKERASRELKKEIEKAAEPLQALLSKADYLPGESGKWLLCRIVEELHTALLPRRQERVIDEFMLRVWDKGFKDAADAITELQQEGKS
jgi:hypothetical protein